MILSRKIPLRHKIMWVVRPLPDLSQRVAKFKKKWEHEVVNVFDNLDTVFKSLAAGTRPMQIKQLGFAHSEPSGIIAIDQKGKGKGAKLKALRLYIYPEESSHVLHVITLGDKDSQSEDIKESVRFVQGLLQSTKADATSDKEVDQGQNSNE